MNRASSRLQRLLSHLQVSSYSVTNSGFQVRVAPRSLVPQVLRIANRLLRSASPAGRRYFSLIEVLVAVAIAVMISGISLFG